MTSKSIRRLQAFSSAIRRTFCAAFHQIQLTACSCGSSATAGLLVLASHAGCMSCRVQLLASFVPHVTSTLKLNTRWINLCRHRHVLLLNRGLQSDWRCRAHRCMATRRDSLQMGLPDLHFCPDVVDNLLILYQRRCGMLSITKLMVNPRKWPRSTESVQQVRQTHGQAATS